MKHLVICIALLTVGACCFAQQKKVASHKAASGNPVFQGWYADPEGIIYDDTYWIFPTWSDLYENQTFFDCFSSKDLVNWTKHASVLDTTAVKWAKKAMWLQLFSRAKHLAAQGLTPIEPIILQTFFLTNANDLLKYA